MTKESFITRLAIVVTAVTGLLAVAGLARSLAGSIAAANVFRSAEQSVFLLFAVFIVYSGLVYQLTRLGHLQRLARHRAPDADELQATFLDRPAPPAVFLIPSYKEEARVIRQALLSTALQEYPERRVVLLIDDPPAPGSAEDAAGLAASRALPDEIQQMMVTAAVPYRKALAAYERRLAAGEPIDPRRETITLAGLYARAAAWFRTAADAWPAGDHTDRLFVEKILRERERRYNALAGAVKDESLDGERLRRHYRRLDALFRAELTSFERKRYANLSHEANKAMNLNSYLGLMGKTFKETAHEDGLHLEPVPAAEATLAFPGATYVATLDADSLLLPDYAAKLVYTMEQPENRRMAVVQTPYSAVPGPSSVVERIAGATTDIQYIIHQGFTRFDATYWVGANAVLRREALEDIRTVEYERGYPVTRYIQDRTVIEDTESTIDLVAEGWRLHNYPERLSYSATPPDFGSLLIQRRRWANGGLIILPKLLRHLFRRPFQPGKVMEGFMRLHYLVSIAAVSLGLLVMLVYPFHDPSVTVFLLLSSVPYFYLYGRDMIQTGYRWSDLARVYALNLMLLPVNLAGVWKSLRQAALKRKSPFGRTPKVAGRTCVPPVYIVILGALTALSLSALGMDLAQGRYAHAVFCAVNSGFFLYLGVRFIGLRNAWEDLTAGHRARTRRTKQPAREQRGYEVIGE